MILNLKNWLTAVIIFLRCKYKQLLHNLKYYPCKILPRKSFILKLNIENLNNTKTLYLLRRNDFSLEDTFDDKGYLREDVLDYKQSDDMSWNLLGGEFEVKHMHYTTSKPGSDDWEGDTINISEYKGCFNYIEDCNPLYLPLRKIHGITIPYITKDKILKEKIKRSNLYPLKRMTRYLHKVNY